MINREFGDFRILSKLGSGAMAEVFLAEQRSLNRRVALKILKSEFSSDETYVKRFVREARSIACITHPNLVQIFQADSIEGSWFIAQEYVQGHTLQKRIRSRGPLPAVHVADILWFVSAALCRVAEAGIVHRDVKPDNILLGDNGDVKIADFGLARVLNTSETSLALTQTGMTLGTPLYMSPEQAQGKTLDQRSDIYSLGVTCYHALAGHPPFRGDTPLAVALQHVNEEPKSLAKIRHDIPPPLVRMIAKMIEKEPEKRYQSFSEILHELRAFYSIFLQDSSAAVRLTDWNQVAINPAEETLFVAQDRLSRAMRKERFLTQKTRTGIKTIAFLFLLSLVGFGAGFFHAYSMPDPLPKPIHGQITRHPTVEEQWVYACMLDNVEAWQSVIDYFPDGNDYWSGLAKRQLVRLYFLEGDVQNAYPIFQEFSELSDVFVDDLALGLVGCAWCLAEIQSEESHPANMQVPLEYLRQLYELNFSYDDVLIIQILDAATKLIRPDSSSP